MQLTLHADYSLRVLFYLAENPGRMVPTEEISSAYGISRHHLVRVIQTLAAHSFVRVSSGLRGGAALARPSAEISLGKVVRKTEPNFRIVECFDAKTNTCPIERMCTLKGVLEEALAAFLSVLDGHTLADLARMPDGQSLSSLLHIAPLAVSASNRRTG